MNRREFSVALTTAALGAAMARPKAAVTSALAAEADGQATVPGGKTPPLVPAPEVPFTRQTVIDRAEQMAKRPFAAPEAVPPALAQLTYDQFRKIRFRKEKALWANQNRGFTVELLHAGFVMKMPVEIWTVADGKATHVVYSPDLFDFGDLKLTVPQDRPLFSGIRINGPIDVPNYYDEVLVFQGASYFRGVGKGEAYGISGRGLAIDTGEPTGEEFPFFRAFWIEQPEAEASTLTVHALLDSQRVTGAFTFVVQPGVNTVLDTNMTLFARADLHHLGIAPLTSMYLFDARERARFDDFRPAVHDSDTLAIARRNGEWIMRPLANPKTLQISAFKEKGPYGFGLQQRADAYDDYKDLEARYDIRPSIWVRPKGEWIDGQVELVEIPTDLETNDNIVAYWRPKATLKAGDSLSYAYWFSFGPAVTDNRLARVSDTRIGMTVMRKRRQFVVEFSPPIAGGAPSAWPSDIEPQITASKGKVENVVARLNPMTGGYQVSFQMDTSGLELSELHLVLAQKGTRISETWLYRWTP